MIAWWIRKDGSGTVLERRELPVPELQGDEMLVRMRATSFNRGDLLARIAHHSAEKPRPIGGDGAGEVIEPGASGFAKGERVLFRVRGSFAEYAAVQPGLATRIPDRLSYEQAAAIPSVFITAWEGLVHYGRVKAGDWVLLAGASSGVGVAALQSAKYLGAKVIAVSGSPHKLDALRALGADAVIAARGPGFADEALRLTDGRGIDVALNLVGGTAFPDCVRAAANFGRVVMVGYVDGQLRAECDLEAVHGRRLEISGISNSPLTHPQRVEAMVGFMRDVFPALADGSIAPVIDRVFPFGEAPAAKVYVETDQHLGKVILRFG